MVDGWIDTINHAEVFQTVNIMKLPSCIGGKRCCPPEDCGGIPGYYGFIESLEDPKSREFKENTEWLGYVYDPENFNIDEVNNNLSGIDKMIRKYEKELNESL